VQRTIWQAATAKKFSMAAQGKFDALDLNQKFHDDTTSCNAALQRLRNAALQIRSS
jgi:hypothetical protein